MAMKVISNKHYLSLQFIFERVVVNQAFKILDDPSHILHAEYELWASGRQYRAISCESSRFKLSFLPISLTLLDKKKERKKTS